MPVSTEVSPQRKRCRQDDGLYEQVVPPLSAVESSARDSRAPNVNVVVRAPTQVEQSVAAVAVTHNGDDRVPEVLSNNLASQNRSGALATTGLDALAAPLGGGPKAGDVLSAAKQAAAVLVQHAHRQEQHLANAAAEQAQQMHRYLASQANLTASCLSQCRIHTLPLVSFAVVLVTDLLCQSPASLMSAWTCSCADSIS